MRPLLGGVVLALVFVSAAGCRKSQAPACQRLISCAEALIPGAREDLHKAYGPEGNCWKDGDSAELCARSCTQALEGLESNPKFASTAQCQPK